MEKKTICREDDDSNQLEKKWRTLKVRWHIRQEESYARKKHQKERKKNDFCDDMHDAGLFLIDAEVLQEREEEDVCKGSSSKSNDDSKDVQCGEKQRVRLQERNHVFEILRTSMNDGKHVSRTR